MKGETVTRTAGWFERNSMKVYTCSKIVEFLFFTLFSIYIAKGLLGP